MRNAHTEKHKRTVFVYILNICMRLLHMRSVTLEELTTPTYCCQRVLAAVHQADRLQTEIADCWPTLSWL